jgi:uncharacterized membrane protein YobD (UPF0266 family)
MDTITPQRPEQEISSQSSPETPLIGWETPEFTHYQHGKRWFLIAILIFVALVVFALITKQWLMAAVIILTAVIVFIFTQQKPKVVPFGISHAGIIFSNRFYPYSEIKSFWIVYEPNVKTINFELTRRLSMIITVQLLDQDPLPIRKFLKKYLPEEKSRGEDFSDRISRLLKF